MLASARYTPALRSMNRGLCLDSCRGILPRTAGAADVCFRPYLSPVQTVLTSVYMAMPSSPFSRPRPDIL